MNSKNRLKGFTFVELVVVISLLSVLLLFSMPVLKRVSILSGDASDTGSFVLLIQSLKQKAVSEHKDYTLHIDTSSGQLWTTDENMNAESVTRAMETAVQHFDNNIVQNIEMPESRQTETGVFRIRFSKSGYSDMALFHIREEDQDITLKVHSFLMNVERFERYVARDDCQ